MKSVFICNLLLVISSFLPLHSKTVTDRENCLVVNLSVCCIEPPGRENREDYRTLVVEQLVDDLTVRMILNTSIELLSTCEELKEEEANRNFIQINDMKLFLDKNLHGIDLDLFIPQRLFLLPENGKRFTVVEMYNFSYTTVGGGYTYIIVELNKQNEIKSYVIFEYIKEPVLLEDLIEEIGRLFPEKATVFTNKLKD